MGGLGVSLAGFAGLISALDRRPLSHSPIAAYRITSIVFLGFMLTVAGFGTVAAYAATGDQTWTIRIGTILLVLPYIRGFLQARPGPAWPRERERVITIVGLIVLTLITLGNVMVAGLGYLEVLMVAALIGPVQIFYNTVRDAARGEVEAAAAPNPAPTPTVD